MGPLIALMFFIGAAVAWAFFAWKPQYANEKQVSVFNWSAIGACAMICASWVLNMSVVLDAESIEKFRWPFAIIGALGIEALFLIVMFVVRNYWIFKPPSRPGGGRWF
ncbi:MAG: hypothetical protein K0R10_626 [Alphaproteobacteria bacterium]|jgi:hypothetical protein|nr:hypothetical protein [Alphaproteobacteria bacterium]